MTFLSHRTLQNTKTASGSLVISNTFPPLLSNPRLMHITSILQMVTRYRTEKCCESLVWFLQNENDFYVMLLNMQSLSNFFRCMRREITTKCLVEDFFRTKKISWWWERFSTMQHWTFLAKSSKLDQVQAIWMFGERVTCRKKNVVESSWKKKLSRKM